MDTDDANPSDEGVCDAESHPVSPGGKEKEKWRRRGSNPKPVFIMSFHVMTYRRAPLLTQYIGSILDASVVHS